MPLKQRNRNSIARRPRRSQSGFEQLIARLRARIEPLLRSDGQPPGPGGFPVRHLILLGVLGAVLVLVFLIGRIVGGDPDEPRPPVQRLETLPVPPIPAAVDGAGAAGGEPPGGDTTAIRQVQVPVPLPAAPAQQAEAPPEPQPIISRQTGGPSAQSPAPAATAPRAPVSPPAERAASTGGVRSADWIMSQPPGNFTLQLVSLSSAERAEVYIAAQPNAAQFATYRLMRNGQLFHVVVHGSHATRAEAEQAAARLPASVGSVQPWIRQFAQVQESVRTALQQ